MHLYYLTECIAFTINVPRLNMLTQNLIFYKQYILLGLFWVYVVIGQGLATILNGLIRGSISRIFYLHLPFCILYLPNTKSWVRSHKPNDDTGEAYLASAFTCKACLIAGAFNAMTNSTKAEVLKLFEVWIGLKRCRTELE